MMKKRITVLAALAVLAIGLTGCGNTAKENSAETSAAQTQAQTVSGYSGIDVESPEWIGKLDAAANSEQVFVVAAFSETATDAWISLHEKQDDGSWHMVMTTPGFIGKNGLGKTKAGDAKTPVGEFHFNRAFGIADDPGSKIPYVKVDGDTYWSGDGQEGHHYNEMVDIKDIPDLGDGKLPPEISALVRLSGDGDDIRMNPGSRTRERELDRATRDVRHKFVDDRRRDRELIAAGLQVISVTSEDLYEPGGMDALARWAMGRIEAEGARNLLTQREALASQDLARTRQLLLWSLLPSVRSPESLAPVVPVLVLPVPVPALFPPVM